MWGVYLSQLASGYEAGTVKEQIRNQVIQDNQKKIVAYARKVTVEKGLSNHQIINDPPFVIQKIIVMEISRNSDGYLKKTAISAQKIKHF